MATYPKGKRYPEIDAEDVSSGIFTLDRIPTPLTGKDADSVDGKNPASASGLATLDATSLVVQEPASKGVASGIASLDATSLVVQKPAGRLGLANLEFTLDKLLKGAGAGINPTEIDPGAILTVAETQVFSGTSPLVWTDLNL